MDSITTNEASIRLTVFISVLVAMAVVEFLAPKRRLEIPRFIRWTNNIALVAADTVLVRVCFPVAAVGIATLANANGWGALNLIEFPLWLSVLIAVLLLDLVIYAQHVLFHKIPVLWRLHRVHHADQDIDVTTGLRFHPIEILISMALKMAVVLAIGAPPVAVIIFEIILNAAAMFNHANLRLPRSVDRVLRLVIVTPDMHRVHHSTDPAEFNRNFGFNVPWWDRLFKTYKPQPKKGHDGMTIGQTRFRTRRDQWLDKMLIQPFRKN